MNGRVGIVICAGLTVALVVIVAIPAHAHAPRVLIGWVLGALTFLAADAVGRRYARSKTRTERSPS